MSKPTRTYKSDVIIKLIDENKGAFPGGRCNALDCRGIKCKECPISAGYGDSMTIWDVRKLDPRILPEMREEEPLGDDDNFTNEVWVPGENVKYSGPAGAFSGLYGVIEEVNATNSQVFVNFGDTHLLNVWLNTAWVIKHHGPLPVKPKVSGGTPTEDPSVKQPSHYQVFDGLESIEVIARSMTVSEFRGFCMGNVLKYRLRAGKKSDQANVTKDLAKAEFYKELFEKHKEKCYASE